MTRMLLTATLPCAAWAALLLAGCGGNADPAPAVSDKPDVAAAPLPGKDAAPLTPKGKPSPESLFPASFRALGTEPFWAVHVSEGRLRYMTPEDQQGQTIDYTREQTARDEFAITAMLGEQEFLLKGRIEECSDGMSDLVYPFEVTLKVGEDSFDGCARPTDF